MIILIIILFVSDHSDPIKQELWVYWMPSKFSDVDQLIFAQIFRFADILV